MKLIECQKCKDLVMLIDKKTRMCECGDIAGKYLDDKITAVVSKNAIVVGIDNNGFDIAKNCAVSEVAQNYSSRVDYFFTGWIPNFPGEVIKVETVDDVIDYDFHLPEEEKNYTSTSPAEISEKSKWKWYNIFGKE